MASINSTMDTAEKMKALEAVKLQIEKQFATFKRTVRGTTP